VTVPPDNYYGRFLTKLPPDDERSDETPAV
jgi:hypothetical protein